MPKKIQNNTPKNPKTNNDIQWFVLMTPFFIPSGLPRTVLSSKITGFNVWVWPFWPLSPGTLPFRSKIYLLKRSKIAETNEMVFTFWLWPSLRLSKAALLVLSLHFRLLTTPFLSHQKWSRKLLIALLLEISVVMSDPCKHSIIDIASPLPKNQFLVPTLWTHVKTLPRQTIMRHVFSCFVLARRPFLPHGIRNGCVFRLLYLRPGGGTKATTRTLLMLYQRLHNRKGKLMNWWRWWWLGLNLIIMLMMIWWRWRRWRPRQQWWEKNHGEGEDKNVESKLVPAPKLADDGAGADDKCWKCLVGGRTTRGCAGAALGSPFGTESGSERTLAVKLQCYRGRGRDGTRWYSPGGLHCSLWGFWNSPAVAEAASGGQWREAIRGCARSALGSSFSKESVSERRLAGKLQCYLWCGRDQTRWYSFGGLHCSLRVFCNSSAVAEAASSLSFADNRYFNIVTFNIRVSIRVRGFHLVFNWESQTPTKSRKNRNGNEIKIKVF